MNSIQSNPVVHYQKTTPAPNHTLFQSDKSGIMADCQHLSAGNDMENLNKEKMINDIWKKDNFKSKKAPELSLNLKATKMTWSNNNTNVQSDNMDEEEAKEEPKPVPLTPPTPDKETATSPSHHARRPMNAFLIFCKKHRPVVRKKYPSLENRGVTRILGEWWALLDSCDKESYTNLAKEVNGFFLFDYLISFFRLSQSVVLLFMHCNVWVIRSRTI